MHRFRKFEQYLKKLPPKKKIKFEQDEEEPSLSTRLEALAFARQEFKSKKPLQSQQSQFKSKKISHSSRPQFKFKKR